MNTTHVTCSRFTMKADASSAGWLTHQLLEEVGGIVFVFV